MSLVLIIQILMRHISLLPTQLNTNEIWPFSSPQRTMLSTGFDVGILEFQDQAYSVVYHPDTPCPSQAPLLPISCTSLPSISPISCLAFGVEPLTATPTMIRSYGTGPSSKETSGRPMDRLSLM